MGDPRNLGSTPPKLFASGYHKVVVVENLVSFGNSSHSYSLDLGSDFLVESGTRKSRHLPQDAPARIYKP